MSRMTRRRRAMMTAQTGGTVHGTWEDLFRTIDAGTYATEYTQGETIELDLGSTLGVLQMEISNFDLDDKADGTGKAPVTLISQNLMNRAVRFNPQLSGEAGNYTVGTGTIGGWKESEVRGWYRNTVYPAIPAVIRARIVQVLKASRIYNADGTDNNNDITSDYVFCPSWREVGGGGSNRESSYQNQAYWALSTTGKRAKGTYWGTRSALNAPKNRYCISATGRTDSSITDTAHDALKVPLCFCVG